MAQILSVERACEIIHGAFEPHDCEAEPSRWGDGVRFRVFGSDGKGLVRWDDIPAKAAGDPSELKDIIELTRQRLTAMGFELAPWKFPEA